MEEDGDNNIFCAHRRLMLFSDASEMGYGATNNTEVLYFSRYGKPLAKSTPEYIAYPSKGKWKGICKSVRGNTLNRIEIFKDFHEIYGLSISPDSKKMVFSASKNGFSDIFLLNIDSEKLKTLSDDFYDDLDPVFSITGDSILFSSNRPISDSLPIEKTLPDFKRKYSLFYQTINQPFKPTLFSSNTGNIIKPHFDKNGKLFCLTDESGVYNISSMNPKGQADSKGQTLTSSKFSILDYAYHPETNRLVFNTLSHLKPRLFYENNILFNYLNNIKIFHCYI
jgi:hypothetical protein